MIHTAAFHSLTTPMLGAAATSRWELLADGLALAVVGLFIVFAALIIMGVALVILNQWGAQAAESPTDPSTESAHRPTPAATPASHPRAEGIDGRTLAILTAAAYTVAGRPVRVHRVHHAREGSDAWARQGRREIQSSHNLAKRGHR